MVQQAYEKWKFYELSIIDLKPDTSQPRKSIDIKALDDLSASVKLKGIIQPILFRVPDDSPYLLIVAGERRYKAAQMAGLLINVGCVTAMQLDVNGDWPNFLLYEHGVDGKLTPHRLDKRMSGNPQRYVNGSTKEFFGFFDSALVPAGSVLDK